MHVPHEKAGMVESGENAAPEGAGRGSRRRIVPLLLLSAVLAPALLWLGNPALALLAGAAITVTADRQAVPVAGRAAALCLQSAIVLLGFKLDLNTLWSLSAAYTGAVAVYVLATLALGLVLGRLLAVESPTGGLISAGTAICGGTAIATLSGVVRAQPQQTAVALGIVFLLNVVALVSFPAIGRAFDLSQLQFGLWSALAIHDTSSVVATAALYGEEALEVATTIKLGRTLWLIPLVFVVSLVQARAQVATGEAPRLRIPLFVLLFVAAAASGGAVSWPAPLIEGAGLLSRALLVAALFLVGTQLTRSTLRGIRGRVLGQALLLWLVVAPLTLALIVWLV